jgi:hypothetical protein
MSVVPLFALQGAVEAVGTYTKLQNSGLDFAKQLELDVGETVDDNLNKMSARLSDDCASQDSVNRLQCQDSESYEMVSSIVVAINPFPGNVLFFL